MTEDLLQGITPLMELMCAFFFVLAFGSFREKVKILLGYDHNFKTPIQELTNKATLLKLGALELYDTYGGNENVNHVILELGTSINKLEEEEEQFNENCTVADLGSTMFFNRNCIVMGFYCITMLMLAALPLNELAQNCILFFNFYVAIFVTFFFVFDVIYTVSKKRIAEKVLTWGSHLKVCFCFFIGVGLSAILYFNEITSIISILPSFSTDLQILFISAIPTSMILFYFLLYLILFRFGLRKSNKALQNFRITVASTEEISGNVNYAINAINNIGTNGLSAS